MFNTYTREQKQDTIAITEAMGDVNVRALQQVTSNIMPDATDKEKLYFIYSLIAEWLDVDVITYQDVLDEQLVEPLYDALHFFILMCSKYIKWGDKLPTNLFVDFVRLDFININKDWQDYMQINLNNINIITRNLGLDTTPNVTTAMFECVVNTAFDFSMNEA